MLNEWELPTWPKLRLLVLLLMDHRCLSEKLSQFDFCVYTFILFSVNVKAQETGNLVDVSVQPSYDTNAFISACTIEYLSDYVTLIEKINSKQITGTQSDALTCRSFFFFFACWVQFLSL